MFGGRPCEREPEVLAAAARGHRLPDALETHAGSCERCREAVRVSAWMLRLADTSGEQANLPDPGTLWWKAQLVRRWDAERRSAAPVESMERVEVMVAAVATVIGAIWGLPILWRWLTGAPAFDTESVARVALSADPMQLVTWVGVALLLLAGGTFYVLHRTLFTDY
jgi:hypothetical protein